MIVYEDRCYAVVVWKGWQAVDVVYCCCAGFFIGLYSQFKSDIYSLKFVTSDISNMSLLVELDVYTALLWSAEFVDIIIVSK